MKAASMKSATWLEAVSIRIMELVEAVRPVSVVAIIKERRSIDRNGRIEPPAERAVEDSVGRKKRKD